MILDEITNEKMTLKEHYAVLWPYVKKYLFRTILAVSLAVPIGALEGVIAWSLKPFMDVVLIEENPTVSFYIPLLIVGFTTLQGILTYFATYINSWVGNKITQDLKRAMYKKLLSFDTSFYDKLNSGIIVQRFCGDADAACAGLLDNTRLFLSRLFSSLSLIAVLIYNSWQLSIIAIVVLIFALLPLAQVKRRIKSTIVKTVMENSKIITNYNETFAGNKTIAAYNMQERVYKKFDDTLKVIFKLSIKLVQKTAWLTPLMHIVVSIGIGAVIGCGSYLIVSKTISSGNFVSFIAALIMLYGPIKSIGKNFSAVQVSFLAIERISAILQIQPKIYDEPNARKLEKVTKNITFENVWFEYNEDVPVLKGINIDVKSGTTVALVGNSGGGKSTIVNLIPRFYEVAKGSIKIDGINIKDITLESLRDNISVVFQDNFLFDGSIKDNILAGKEDASWEEIDKALKLAYLDDFVSELENGLDTYVGERGSKLSGGQKQRLAIARAFIKDSPIVILDEATSALDNKSEAVVQKAIENLMKDRTVFVVAHRLSTIVNADMIVVVNDGEIIESGSHEELLLVENGAYVSLYNAQFKNKKEQ